MSNLTSNRLEISLLGIFRWGVMAAMLILIAVTLYFIGTGVSQFSTPAQTPEPEKPAAKPSFSSQEFLNSIKPQTPVKTAQPAESASPATNSADASEAMFSKHIEHLYDYVAKYQADCGAAAPLAKAEFIESLRQTNLKKIIEERSPEFAGSQNAFAKEMLGNAETIKLCKSGQSGLFYSILNFHRTSWDRQIKAVLEFESNESERISNFQKAEERNAAVRQASAYQKFYAAAITFGLFMSVALSLIFARIESNLRGLVLSKEV